jgi:hypothetical protein
VIHVLDELSVQPGHLGDVRDLVRRTYEPVATSHGMALVNTWIDPAVELLEQPTDLLLLWEVGDTAAFWATRAAAARDPAVVGFWEEVAPMLSGRRRRIRVDPDDSSVLR